MTKMFMMVGLPASGKSYQAQIYADRYNAQIFSSDAYRGVIGVDETDQSVTGQVFAQMIPDMINTLLLNKSIIFDATNTNSKKRRHFLNQIKKIKCEKICVLVLRTFDNCIKANKERERTVPDWVISKYYKSFETPYLEEGFDSIEVVYTDNDSTCLGYPHQFIQKYENYNQHNSHHTQTLGHHCLSVQNYILDHYIVTKKVHGLELYFAAQIHDCGKPFCQTYTNMKGEPTEEAHYYGHEAVGAYDSLFYNFYDPAIDKLLISFLISNHMRPMNWVAGTKAEQRCRANWGEKKFNLIKILHEADISAK